MKWFKWKFVLCSLLILAACNKEIVRENKPITESNAVSQIAKSDIDNVLDVHIKQSQVLLRELMIKLYKRNPRELKKSELKLIEEQLVRLFDLEHSWDFPELQDKHDIELIKLTFKEEYQGDRVFAFVSGLMSMIMKSYNYQSDFYLFDTVEPQKLYNCARNIEIAVWKLGHNVDSNGDPFLCSNSLPNEGVTNLSYERLFGKLIATQDNITTIMAEKKNRTVKTVIQRMASAVFLPI
ncbi:MAG: hypothetical protein ACPHLK_08585 [Gammaproteobacteria bacterium]|jgi:hypothetical protein